MNWLGCAVRVKICGARREISEKSRGYLLATAPVRYQFIQEHREPVQREGDVPGAGRLTQQLLCLE
jgi:hypothetical protein